MSDNLQGIGGIKMQGERITVLRFADDIAVLTESEEELAAVLEEIQHEY